MGKTLFYLGDDEVSTHEHITNKKFTIWEKVSINFSILFYYCYE
jgi:hypothetical protein